MIRLEYQDQELSLTTNSNGEVIVEGSRLFVSPGGRYVFSVSATDDNGTKRMSNGYIETERLLHYVEVKMDNLASITSSLASFENEYLKNGVRFKALPSVNIPLMKNVYSRAEKDIFKSHVQTALVSSQAAAHSAHCVTIAYVDHIAEKGDLELDGFCRGGSDGTVNFRVQHHETLKEFALWHDLDDTSDWFISCEFIPTDGSPIISIGKEKCTPLLKSGYQSGYYDNVNIDVSSLPEKQGGIEMLVNIVKGMRAGLSLGNSNIVAVCTRRWWVDYLESRQNLIAIHEVGHQLGMACDGEVNKPAKIPTFYNNSQGHVGPHCHYGIPAGQARYDAVADHALSECVMYGSVNGHTAFCPHCSEALKKSDLKNGV